MWLDNVATKLKIIFFLLFDFNSCKYKKKWYVEKKFLDEMNFNFKKVIVIERLFFSRRN